MKTKQVFPNEEVAHLFANQLHDSARNPGGNLFIQDNAIWSYGRHFCIAKFATNENGERKLLFTTRSYSNTTAKQIWQVRHATNHIDKIYCPDPNDYKTTNVANFVGQIKFHLKGLVTAKKPEKYIEPAKAVYENLKKYCEFFSLDIPIEATNAIIEAENGKYKEYLQTEKARIDAEKEAQILANEKEAKLQLAKWRKFKTLTRSLRHRLNDRDYLRFNVETKRVETSQNVEIPEAIAKRAYKWVKTTVKNGGCSGECEYKILDYTVKAVSETLIEIGCHKIDVKEIDKLAKQLKWTK